MIEKLRDQRADWRTVERKAAANDRVVVDFAGNIDGEPFQGGQGQEIAIVIGSGQVLDDFDKALVGVGAGEHEGGRCRVPERLSDRKPRRQEGSSSRSPCSASRSSMSRARRRVRRELRRHRRRRGGAARRGPQEHGARA